MNSFGYIHFGGDIRNLTILLLLSLSYSEVETGSTLDLRIGIHDFSLYDYDSELNEWNGPYANTDNAYMYYMESSFKSIFDSESSVFLYVGMMKLSRNLGLV